MRRYGKSLAIMALFSIGFGVISAQSKSAPPKLTLSGHKNPTYNGTYFKTGRKHNGIPVFKKTIGREEGRYLYLRSRPKKVDLREWVLDEYIPTDGIHRIGGTGIGSSPLTAKWTPKGIKVQAVGFKPTPTATTVILYEDDNGWTGRGKKWKVKIGKYSNKGRGGYPRLPVPNDEVRAVDVPAGLTVYMTDDDSFKRGKHGTVTIVGPARVNIKSKNSRLAGKVSSIAVLKSR